MNKGLKNMLKNCNFKMSTTNKHKLELKIICLNSNKDMNVVYKTIKIHRR